jgi:hypothetical protein
VVADYQSVVLKHQALLDIWTVALLRSCIVAPCADTAIGTHALLRTRIGIATHGAKHTGEITGTPRNRGCDSGRFASHRCAM